MFFYIKSDDGRENFIELNPKYDTFAYSLNNESDDVRVFIRYDKVMYRGYFN